MSDQNIAWFNQVDYDDLDIVGEHGGRLGEFTKAGISIPEGFIVTSHAFNDFLDQNNLKLKAKHLLTTVNFNDPNSLKQVSSLIRKYFIEAQFPSNFKIELYNAYKKISGLIELPSVKIIASPVNGVNHSLLRHFEEVRGESSLITAIKNIWAQNFTELNIVHNHQDPKFIKSVVVQKILNPDKSGKIYTIDAKNKDLNKIIIKAHLGLSDDNHFNYVTMPDYYEIKKDSHEVLNKELFPQLKMSKKINSVKKLVDVPKSLRNSQKLFTNEIEELVRSAKSIEKFTYFPQEIDFGIEKNKIYILHTKPISALS